MFLLTAWPVPGSLRCLQWQGGLLYQHSVKAAGSEDFCFSGVQKLLPYSLAAPVSN